MAIYITAREVADSVLAPINYVALMYEADPPEFQQILNDLVTVIQRAWQVKVEQSALNGFKSMVIYRYYYFNKFQDFPIRLLINGPPQDPDFFVKKGYISVMDQLRSILAPAVVTNYYSNKNKGSMIFVNWTN
jgi:hypothetical protein